MSLTLPFPPNHPRGRKLTPKHVVAQRKKLSKISGLHTLPKAPPPSTYDCGGLGQTPTPIDDQGQCGNCYEHSGVEVCAAGQLVAGIVTGPFNLSAQYMLDYHPELGGCDGGDEWAVAQMIQSGGCPSTAQYSGPGQAPGDPQPLSGLKMYKIGRAHV